MTTLPARSASKGFVFALARAAGWWANHLSPDGAPGRRKTNIPARKLPATARVPSAAKKKTRALRGPFEAFCRAPHLLPPRYVRRVKGGRPERVVCDNVAGMTDRHAQDEYERLFHPYTIV